jgi:hypothetical protein
MAEEFEVVDVWLCRFPSEAAADTYFEETYGDDDRLISQFGADMGERFYDHDFIERGAFYDPPITSVADAVAAHSYSSSYLAEVIDAFHSKPCVPFKTVLLVWNREIERPASVAHPERALDYLGRFECDLAAGPAA